MKMKLSHAVYMARKISKDIITNEHINVAISKEEMVDIVQSILEAEVIKETKLEEEVDKIISDVQEEEMGEFEYVNIDYKQVFWMAKKKLAKKYDFILDSQDRYTDISHKIINTLVDKQLIDYSMSETVIKNIVFNSIMDFIQIFKDIEESVSERILHYKRKIIPGTEDYDLVYKKLYEESLSRKGLL